MFRGPAVSPSGVLIGAAPFSFPGCYYIRMVIKFQKLDPNATLPSYAHPGDAGMDVFALERTVFAPGERKGVRTGFAMEIPDGHVALVWDKGGVGIKGGMKTLGGVIDAGYRGEVMIGMVNLSGAEYAFEAGHKVAQILIQRVERLEIEEAEKLSDTSRGAGGFGSTGK